MPTWVDPAVIRASVASGLPAIGVGGTGYDIADDLEYLKDQADAVGIQTLQDIHDDFTADELNKAVSAGGGADYPYAWDVAGAPALDGAPDHYLHCVSGEGLAASKYKMRIDLDRDHSVAYEIRHRSNQSDAATAWFFGFRDASYAANATTLTDSIIFRQGTTAQKYKCYLSKAGVNSTIADDQGGGGTAVWYALRIEITFSGATKRVEFFIDGVSVASTTDTTIIPLVKLRPSFLTTGGGGTRHNYYDYIDAYWRSRPLSN